MSLYELHKCLSDVHSKPDITAAYQRDPESVFCRYTLSAAELAALRAKDIYRLHTLGANIMLLALFARLHGIPLVDIPEILRVGAAAERQRQV